jgi:hypothetical protein
MKTSSSNYQGLGSNSLPTTPSSDETIAKQTNSMSLKTSFEASKNPSSSTSNNLQINSQEETKKNRKVKLKSIENLSNNVTSKNSKSECVIYKDEKSCETLSTKSTMSQAPTSRFNYSYVVLAASFVAYMLASLLGSCFGVFFESMEADLGLSKMKVAFIGGIISSLQDLSGPISSAMTNQFGCRKTAIFGGFIAALGMIGSAYVSNFWLLGFLMGGVSGFGSSLVLVSSVVVVTYYFEEKPSFAAGLTISGGSFGQSIFTMIIIKLTEIYGRSGCFLILGGILLNIIVCAGLYRPLQWELDEDDDDDDEDDEEDDTDEEEDEDDDENEKEKDCDGQQSSKEDKNKIRAIESVSSKSDSMSRKADKIKYDEDDKNIRPVGAHTSVPSVRSKYFDDLIVQNAQEFYNEIAGDTISTQSSKFFIQPDANRANLGNIPIKLGELNKTKFASENNIIKHTFQSNKELNNLHEVITDPFFFTKCQSQQIESTNAKWKNDFYSTVMNVDFTKNFISNDSQLIGDNTVVDLIDNAHQQEAILNTYFQHGSNSTLKLSENEYVIIDPTLFKSNSTVSLSSRNELFLRLKDMDFSPSMNHLTINSNQLENLNSIEGLMLDNDNTLSNENTTFGKISSFSSKLSEKVSNDLAKSKLSDDPAQLRTTVPEKSSTSASTSKWMFNFQKILNFIKPKEKTNATVEHNEKNKLEQEKLEPLINKNESLITPSLNNPSNSNKVVNVPFDKIVVVKNTSNKSAGPLANTGQKVFTIRCNCKAKMQKNPELHFKKRSTKLWDPELGISDRPLNNQSKDLNNNAISKDAHLTQPNVLNKKQTHLRTNKQNPNKLPSRFRNRHTPDCRLYYLDGLINQRNSQRAHHPHLNHNPHHHHHHHHHHHQQQHHNQLAHRRVYYKGRVYYVPNIFQNSYRVPLHFKNVYYYKSLLNLNMRLMTPKPRMTLAFKDTDKEINNLSISCPDLNLKQLLLIDNNKFNESTKSGFFLDVHHRNNPQNQSKDIHKEAKWAKGVNHSNLRQSDLNDSKVLNAGNILLKSSAFNQSKSKMNANEKEKALLIPQIIKEKENAEQDDESKTKKLDDQMKREKNEQSDEEDDDEEEEEEEDDEESDDEDVKCCMSTNPTLNSFVKCLNKTLLKPIKLSYYSVLENLKLFKIFHFCIFAFCNFVLSFFYESPFYFINSYMIENGSSESQAGTITISVGIVSVFSSSKLCLLSLSCLN